MSESRKHIAASGKNAGHFVPCQAQQHCRVGGVHVSKTELNEIKKWSGKASVNDLTVQDQIGYMQSKIAATNPKAKFEDEKVTQFKEEANGIRGRVGEIGNEPLTRDERDAAYAQIHNLDGKVEKVVNLNFSRLKWQVFVQRVVKEDINVPLDVLKAGGQAMHAGDRRIVIEGVPLRGKEASLTNLIETLRIF